MSGIINVRGTVATVINLAKRFHLVRETEGPTDQYIVLVQTERALFGMQVDAVNSVMKIEAHDVHPATGVGESKVQRDFIQGVATVGERVILILDVRRLLQGEEPAK